jgi:tRNA pseudouridine38-40 synthase
MVRRLRIRVEYDGTEFSGWQVQPDKITVQGELIRAFETFLRSQVHLIGSGRTDAGVHARWQVVHVDIAEEIAANIDLNRLIRAISAIAGRGIAVKEADWAPEGFHARFSARERRYRYRMSLVPQALRSHMVCQVRSPLDIEAMNEAAGYLVGKYPATSFCAAYAKNIDAVVDVRRAELSETGDILNFDIAADRFVTQMVRIIVGTLIDVGRGRRSPGDIPGLIQARDRKLAGQTAHPRGLCLEYVEYET